MKALYAFWAFTFAFLPIRFPSLPFIYLRKYNSLLHLLSRRKCYNYFYSLFLSDTETWSRLNSRFRPPDVTARSVHRISESFSPLRFQKMSNCSLFVTASIPVLHSAWAGYFTEFIPVCDCLHYVFWTISFPKLIIVYILETIANWNKFSGMHMEDRNGRTFNIFWNLRGENLNTMYNYGVWRVWKRYIQTRSSFGIRKKERAK